MHTYTHIHIAYKFTAALSIVFFINTHIKTVPYKLSLIHAHTHSKAAASPLLPLELVSMATGRQCAEVQHPSPDVAV